MFKTLSIPLVALGMMTVAAAADAQTAAEASSDGASVAVTGDTRSPAAEASSDGFSVAVSGDDSLEDFQAVVDGMLAEKNAPADSGDRRVKGDAVPAAVAIDSTGSPGVRHREHLGLGFGHGVRSRGNSGLAKPDYNSPNRLKPRNENCDGNGHPRNPNANSNGNGSPDTEAQAQGYTQHPGTFGSGDCGEPSPSD